MQEALLFVLCLFLSDYYIGNSQSGIVTCWALTCVCSNVNGELLGVELEVVREARSALLSSMRQRGIL